MDEQQLKSDLIAVAAALKMVREKAEKYQPDYAGAWLCIDQAVEELRAAWAILFHK